MKPYVLSFAVGVGVGVVYALLKVRSPAPPIVALIGLLGMLIGEQLPTYLKGIAGSRWAHVASVTNDGHAARTLRSDSPILQQKNEDGSARSEKC